MHEASGPTVVRTGPSRLDRLGLGERVGSARVDGSGLAWNEERFFMEGDRLSWTDLEYAPVTPYGRRTYWGGEVREMIRLFHTARRSDKAGYLLLVSEHLPDGTVSMEASPVGELNGHGMGVAEAYRGHGGGGELHRRAIYEDWQEPAIGYSPAGLRSLGAGWRRAVRARVLEGGAPGEWVFRDLPDLEGFRDAWAPIGGRARAAEARTEIAGFAELCGILERADAILAGGGPGHALDEAAVRWVARQGRRLTQGTEAPSPSLP